MAVSFNLPGRTVEEEACGQVIHVSVDSDGDLRLRDFSDGESFYLRPANIQAFAEAVSAIAAELKKVETDNG